MSAHFVFNHLFSFQNLNNNTYSSLIPLRWFYIIGQACIVGTSFFVFKLKIPIAELSLTLTVYSIWALYIQLIYRRSNVMSPRQYFFQLLTDCFELSVVLYFTGGASNPFVSLYLIPIALSAVMLPKHYIFLTGLFSATLYSFLFFFSYSEQGVSIGLNSHHNFQLHLFGMWANFLISALCIMIFVSSLAKALQRRDQIISEAREESLRNENILSVASLAAGAAHEMGTPLSTISILADEIQEQLNPKDLALTNDLILLKKQIEVCRKALYQLKISSTQPEEENQSPITLKLFLDQIFDKWCLLQPAINNTLQFNGDCTQYSILPNTAIAQTLLNLLNNAAQASLLNEDNRVEVIVDFQSQNGEQMLSIVISDYGPGLAPNINNNTETLLFTNKENGLGLGLLLSRFNIEQLGGQLNLQNTNSGLKVSIMIPLNAMNFQHSKNH